MTGIVMQINAAFLHDVMLPKKYTKAIPNAAAIEALAVSIPRMLGSLQFYTKVIFISDLEQNFSLNYQISPMYVKIGARSY